MSSESYTSYRETYSRLSDDQLDDLFGEFHELTLEAQEVLVTEALQRGRTQAELDTLVAAGEMRATPLERTEGADLELTAKVGSVVSFNGCGRAFYGKSNVVVDRDYWFEEFDTTLWWRFFFIPLLPQMSLRIRKKILKIENPAERGYGFVVVRRIPFLF